MDLYVKANENTSSHRSFFVCCDIDFAIMAVKIVVMKRLSFLIVCLFVSSALFADWEYKEIREPDYSYNELTNVFMGSFSGEFSGDGECRVYVSIPSLKNYKPGDFLGIDIGFVQMPEHGRTHTIFFESDTPIKIRIKTKQYGIIEIKDNVWFNRNDYHIFSADIPRLINLLYSGESLDFAVYYDEAKYIFRLESQNFKTEVDSLLKPLELNQWIIKESYRYTSDGSQTLDNTYAEIIVPCGPITGFDESLVIVSIRVKYFFDRKNFEIKINLCSRNDDEPFWRYHFSEDFVIKKARLSFGILNNIKLENAFGKSISLISELRDGFNQVKSKLSESDNVALVLNLSNKQKIRIPLDSIAFSAAMDELV